VFVPSGSVHKRVCALHGLSRQSVSGLTYLNDLLRNCPHPDAGQFFFRQPSFHQLTDLPSRSK
jgi:hypothetical protein